MDLIILNNTLVPQAKTSQCVTLEEDKELMRAWVISFSIANSNNARQYITQDSVFSLGGQYFDIFSLSQSSGYNNITSVMAEHVSYRLNDYIIPPGYSYLGTVAQIISNMLLTAKNGYNQSANTQFAVGTTASLGTVAFSLGNEQEVTLRSALLGLQNIGVEVSYNNFQINAPARVGSTVGHTFDFGIDLVDVQRSWAKGDGATYNVSIVNTGQYALGDSVTINDTMLGDTFSRRIVQMHTDYLNPANDSITLGVFIRDSATNAVRMQAEINTKLTEGEGYKNVEINRTDGFVSMRNDKTVKAIMNGDDCFACYVYESGVWVKKSFLDEFGLVASRISSIKDPIKPWRDVHLEISANIVDDPYLGLRLVNTMDGQNWFNVRKATETNGFYLSNETGEAVFYSSASVTRVGYTLGNDITFDDIEGITFRVKGIPISGTDKIQISTPNGTRYLNFVRGIYKNTTTS